MHVKLFSKIHLPTSVLDCNVVATYVETIELRCYIVAT